MKCPHCGTRMFKRYVAHYLTFPPTDEYVWHCDACLSEIPGGVEQYEYPDGVIRDEECQVVVVR